ncbi:MAG: AmmeMemoRadiSam system protein A [Tenericutes bacterium]|nr:AmmeMemoRadiSam system protein A [Mycoplasmatota bacterium]
MSILKGYCVPHPPLIIPEIGDGLEKDIIATSKAYTKIAKEIAQLAPDTIIISSPHTTVYGDYFHISPGDSASGSFERFHHPEIQLNVDYDTELIGSIISLASTLDFPVSTHGERDAELDHGTMIPLYYVNKFYKNYKIIRIGISGLSLMDHYSLGKIIRSVIPRKQKVVWIASGDLSHKLKEDGPYGFAEEGPVYDREVTKILADGNFYELLKFKSDFCNKASECGLGSFTMMAGAFDGYTVEPKLLSYEGPFGVGYALASFKPLRYSDDREFARTYKEREDRQFRNKRMDEDEYITLARAALEYYINNHQELAIPKETSNELLKNKAGVFVSLYINSNLRGCIGTISPTTNSIAEEIIQNTVSAGTRDYRFNKVRANELERIEYSVDILKPAKAIKSKEELDVKKYGLIVRSGKRSGLLLPNITGINTIDEQIRIAKRKAGIRDQEDCKMERFEVIRHK